MNTFFTITLLNVLVMLFYMFIGFFLKKAKKNSTQDIPGISQILIYGLTPILVFNNFLKMDFSWEAVLDMGLFFLISFLVQFIFLVLVLLVFCRKKKDVETRVMAVGGILGNVGFFGLPIIQALFPDNPIALCYVSMAMVSMNILLFTFGEHAVSGIKRYISLKGAFLNPTLIGFYISFIAYCLGIKNYLPDVLKNACGIIASMTAPLSMIILGIRLASASFKNLITDKKAWVSCLLKLVVFPLFTYGVLYFSPFTDVFKTSMLVLMAAPGATVLLSLAEIHKGGQQNAADTLLLTSVLSVITIPLFMLL